MLEKIKEFQIIISCALMAVVIFIVGLTFASKIQKNENITVTGSASKIVKSDSAKLGFSLNTRAKNQKEGYLRIKSQENKIRDYLVSKGIDKKDINFKTITGYYNYKTDSRGFNTNEINYYSAEQYVEVNSDDVLKIKELASDIGSLSDGIIDINPSQPEFFYSDLASIKVELLKEAALDAKQRANSMLSATGARVGRVQSMKMGVFQITPPDSTMVADFGYNDTSTIDKKVTAVSNIVFRVK